MHVMSITIITNLCHILGKKTKKNIIGSPNFRGHGPVASSRRRRRGRGPFSRAAFRSAPRRAFDGEAGEAGLGDCVGFLLGKLANI